MSAVPTYMEAKNGCDVFPCLLSFGNSGPLGGQFVDKSSTCTSISSLSSAFCICSFPGATDEPPKKAPSNSDLDADCTVLTSHTNRIHIYIYKYIHMHVCICTYACIYVCVCIYMFTYLHTYMHT